MCVIVKYQLNDPLLYLGTLCGGCSLCNAYCTISDVSSCTKFPRDFGPNDFTWYL